MLPRLAARPGDREERTPHRRASALGCSADHLNNLPCSGNQTDSGIKAWERDADLYKVLQQLSFRDLSLLKWGSPVATSINSPCSYRRGTSAGDDLYNFIISTRFILKKVYKV